MILKEDIVLTLPLTFENIACPVTIMAVPDTGAEVNVISFDLAAEMGIAVEKKETRLRLPNGLQVHCDGLAKTTCRFAKATESCFEILHCIFHVVRNLASPMMICQEFLSRTETMTRYTSRLIKMSQSLLRIPRIRTLGRTQHRLLCSLHGEDAEALADSGSEVDVMSLQYAFQRGFNIDYQEGWVMFANRTVARTCGVIRVQLAAGLGVSKLAGAAASAGSTSSAAKSHLGDITSTPPLHTPTSALDFGEETPITGHKNIQRVIWTEFHVLDGMEFDVIVGIGSLVALDVYRSHADSLVVRESHDEGPMRVNRIILLEGKLWERARAWITGAGNRLPLLGKFALSSSLNNLLIRKKMCLQPRS